MNPTDLESNELKQPKPDSENYNILIRNIKKGYIKIPDFQRDFVWDIEDVAKLLDSILKGYPVGNLIFWTTRERLKSIRNLGNINLPDTPEGEPVHYVLDGQQRLTALFIALQGLQIEKDKNKISDYKKIYLDLDLDENTDDELITIVKPDNNYISVYELLSSDHETLVKNYPNHISKTLNYKGRFDKYNFSTIFLPDYTMDDAVEVFTRINTTGEELTLFEIMVAKTYDEKYDFDLQKEYNKLIKDIGNFDTIPGSTILQCISLNLQKECTRKSILKLNKKEIIEHWDGVVESIKATIDYFRTFYRIPVSRLLPYNALIVPFAYFFFKTGLEKPNFTQELYLQEYFWRSSLSYRFSNATESRLGRDAKRIDEIIDEKQPEYDFNIILDDQIKYKEFSAGDSYCKAILSLFAYFEPKSFDNNSNILLDNSWLKIATSRNYHHFFPRSYLKKNHIANDNSVVNITLVDDHLNKKKIGSKPPSDYMGQFKENKNLEQTMKTHLIDDLDEFGIWENDYNKFLDKRSERIIDELKKRINID